MDKPVFDKINQISIIVEDIFESIKQYEEGYGIGPWTVLKFNPDNTSEMIIKGNREDFEMYLALCDSMNVQLELIQPITENTTYYEFLKQHGSGIHHLCMGSSEGYSSMIQKLKDIGHSEKLLGGTDSGGHEFCYIDLTEDLGLVAELLDH